MTFLKNLQYECEFYNHLNTLQVPSNNAVRTYIRFLLNSSLEGTNLNQTQPFGITSAHSEQSKSTTVVAYRFQRKGKLHCHKIHYII